MITPPVFPFDLDSLPENNQERHERVVELFGDYMMWIRGQTMEHVSSLTSSVDSSHSIARVSREPYEAVASMSVPDREKAIALAKVAIDSYAKIFLTMLSGTGNDQRLGVDHSAKFLLSMEIHDIEKDEVVVDEIVNRGGKKFFPEYWGRWINKRHQASKGDEAH